MKEGRKPQYPEETCDDELQKMPHTKARKVKPQSRLEPALLDWWQARKADMLTITLRDAPTRIGTRIGQSINDFRSVPEHRPTFKVSSGQQRDLREEKTRSATPTFSTAQVRLLLVRNSTTPHCHHAHSSSRVRQCFSFTDLLLWFLYTNVEAGFSWC